MSFKPTYKKGGTNPSKYKPSKNDRAMVSGVSSILRKIKDKKNRKEVAGDMVNQFNREGVNYNKEKFLKNSRSYQFGGASRADSLNLLANSRAVQNYYAGKNYKRDNESMSMRGLGGLGALADLNTSKNEYYSRPNEIVMTPTGVKPRKLIDYYQRVDNNKFYQRENANSILDTRAPRQLFDRRIEPTSYLSFNNINTRDPMHEDQIVLYSYDPISVTPWDMLNTQQRKQRIDKYGFSGTPYKNKLDYINKTTTAKKPKTTTSTVNTISPKSTATTAKTTSTTIPSASTPSTSVSTTTTSNTAPTNTPTTLVQTPKQLPGNTSQMQRYNYMSTEDKKRAVKKYGDSSKVPFQGVDVNQLRKEVPTFKSGGQHGGLDRWFAEKWVDVKSGKACGRQEGESRAYPACRPSKRISSKTPKTSSELSSKEKARFKSTKTSSQRIPYNHKRMQLGAMSSSDSVRHQANKILKYEQLRGGPGGTPLPQYSDPKYLNMLMNDIYPKVKKIMPNATAMEAGEAMDFIFNAGWDKENKKILKDPRAFALQEYYRQYDKSKLDKEGNWSGRKQPISNELYASTIGKLPENQRRILMNKGRDWYYKNTNNPAPGVPNPNYQATWYGRIWNTNDFLPFNPNNPKFIYKNK